MKSYSIIWCAILAATFCEALVEIQSNGVTTSGTHFCTKDELVFTCTLLVSGYDWVALPFLDGTPGNGRVSLGTTETVGNFTLSASGTGPTRTSTLQVTAFPGLNGVNVLCRDSGDPGYSQSVNITVFGIADIPVLSNIQQSGHSNNNGLMFNFDVLQSGIASFCVFKYNIMITGNGCNYTHTKLVDVTELNATYNTMSVGALPVCCEEYEFRVSAVDRSNRESTPAVGQHIVDFSALGSFSGMFFENMAGGIIEVTVPPLLGPHILDYFYTYKSESGRISDICNKFTLIQTTRITIMDPCMDCSIKLAPIICNLRMNFTSKRFSVNIHSTLGITGASTFQMGQQDSQTCETYLGSLIGVTTVGSAIIATLVATIVALGCKLKASGSVKQRYMNYGHNQQKKSNAKKVGVVDGEVVMEDCLAYGRVQVRTDVLSTSRDEIEVPQVYEAI